MLASGEVLTAAHVVSDAGVPLRGLEDMGFRGWEAANTWRPLATGATARVQPEHDLAYLKPTALIPGRSGAEIAKDRGRSGDRVFALLPSVRQAEGAMAIREGEILGWSTDRAYFAVDIAGIVGDSGAPVFNRAGEVAGIVVARSDAAELGFPFTLTREGSEYRWKWDWPSRRVFNGPFLLCARP